VTGVPKSVVNERVEILGAVPQDVFVEQVLAGTREPEQQPNA
jgi:predicted DsbA family dithiol-disulfide isomerase